jgi:hypothetical protein
MTEDLSFERLARDWLELGPLEAPSDVVQAAFLEIDKTPQERDLRVPWRFQTMNRFALLGAAAATIVAVGLVGLLLALGPNGPAVGTGPTPTQSASATQSPTTSPAPSPMALREGVLSPGSYVTEPFWRPGSDRCFDGSLPIPTPLQSGCTDSRSDDAIRITFTMPGGWQGFGVDGVWTVDGEPPDEAALGFGRGAWLFSDPCLTDERIQAGVVPDIEVGPTVDDFANAIADHPLLVATTPIDVTVGGYSGKYLDLQLPADLSGCREYRPWWPGGYAQGPSHRWHLWILDVDGVRVVLQGMDYASTSATSAKVQAELRAMVDSMQIEP